MFHVLVFYESVCRTHAVSAELGTYGMEISVT